jgi:hypothetical protein
VEPERQHGQDVDDPVARFDALPRRLFLDSSTLQALMGYGEFVWENVEPPPCDRAHSMPDFLNDLEALRLIFQVNNRAGFDIVITENSLAEVEKKAKQPSPLASRSIGTISVGRLFAFSARPRRRLRGALRIAEVQT